MNQLLQWIFMCTNRRVLQQSMQYLHTKVNVEHCGIGSLHYNVLVLLNGLVEVEDGVSYHGPHYIHIFL